MADKPNIILIFPDQHRGDTMGCAGNPAVRTPNLDRLAAEGVTFQPSNRAVLTRRCARRHGHH